MGNLDRSGVCGELGLGEFRAGLMVRIEAGCGVLLGFGIGIWVRVGPGKARFGAML